MRYSICIIDDEIPAAGVTGVRDTDLLNSSNLEYLLRQEEHPWTDEVVKKLIETLLGQTKEDGTPKWDVYAFTNPGLYINYLDRDTFRTDLLVFDWDYSAAGVDSEALLKEILSKTFCLVFVFSKFDKQEEIEAVLAKPEFAEYQGRVRFLSKGDQENDNVETLLQTAEEMNANNFSFRLAGDLRRKSIQIMDKILSELGRATLSNVKNYLALEEGGEKRELVDFIAERFRAGLVGTELPTLAAEQVEGAEEEALDGDLVKKIWSYRLYLPNDDTVSAGDELVRRGDIVKYEDKYYLVVTADCDLRFFWKKNFGSVNLLPLHPLRNSNTELKEVLTFCVEPQRLKSSSFKSLTAKVGDLSEGPFILPFVRQDDSFECFIAMPKEMISKRLPTHADVSALATPDRKKAKLKYAWWEGAEKLCSVSEPFLSAIIQHTFGVIGGYGTPNYPPKMKEVFDEILDEFIAAPPAADEAPEQ